MARVDSYETMRSGRDRRSGQNSVEGAAPRQRACRCDRNSTFSLSVGRRLSHFPYAALLIFILMACSVGWCLQDNASIGSLVNRAHKLVVGGKYSQAAALLQQVLRSRQDSSDAHFLLGYIYFRQQRARRSLAEFTAGARTRQPGVDDLRIVAADYVLLADYTDAAKWFGVVASISPQDPNNWYLLGRAQYNENLFRQAIASFQRVLALRDKDVRAENNMGLAWEGLNKEDTAAKAFQKAIAWQGAQPRDAQPYLNQGSLLINKDHPRQALRYLKTAVRLAPRNPKIREQLARAYKMQNNLAQAQRQLEAAVELVPKVAGLHYQLGQVFWHEGLHEQAQKQFKICAHLNGGHSAVATPNPYSPNN